MYTREAFKVVTATASAKAPASSCAGRSRPPGSSSPIRSCCSTRWARSTTAPGEAVGAPDHPHRGFETVTYMLDGEFEHEDSAGPPRRARRPATCSG